jgi:hypothetical protein
MKDQIASQIERRSTIPDFKTILVGSCQIIRMQCIIYGKRFSIHFLSNGKFNSEDVYDIGGCASYIISNKIGHVDELLSHLMSVNELGYFTENDLELGLLHFLEMIERLEDFVKFAEFLNHRMYLRRLFLWCHEDLILNEINALKSKGVRFGFSSDPFFDLMRYLERTTHTNISHILLPGDNVNEFFGQDRIRLN